MVQKPPLSSRQELPQGGLQLPPPVPVPVYVPVSVTVAQAGSGTQDNASQNGGVDAHLTG
ncbi:MAG: hypothetical protein H6757_05040 [Candidatus Omnitrophica bacterium]|nr:hypothetical protein [Candidatus Omnitrophota bacterium]